MATPRYLRREYKVIIDHSMFTDRKVAAEELSRDLRRCAKRQNGVKFDGDFNKTKKREIIFLDTPDQTIRLNDLIFRMRTDLEKDETEYTLKCRSPDRFVATAKDLRAAQGLNADEKHEEDIAAPFVCRFSHSNAVEGPKKRPKTLQGVAKLFRALGKLKRDGDKCPDKTEIRPVSALKAYERVLVGPTISFDGTKAEVALILWSNGPKGPLLIGELSYRYRTDDGDFSAKTARLAMEFFLEIQRLRWYLAGGTTKTRYAYREQ